MISVVVADDHPLFRRGVVRAIEEDGRLSVVGEAENGHDALREIRRRGPELAILDMHMPGMDGLAVLEQVTAAQLPTRVMMLSAFAEPALVHRALAAGASGFLAKETEDAALCSALVRAAIGEIVVNAELLAAVMAQIGVQRDVVGHDLSERERSVLELVAQGKSSVDIAAVLSLSPSTVKTYLGRLYEKLGVTERAAAVAEGMRRGLIS
jgi:two-component system, NarL family, nitrate/nitrite response regulator NarL